MFANATIASPSAWEWRSTVARKLKPGAKTDFSSLRSYLALTTRIVAIELWLSTHQQELAGGAGPAGLHNPGALSRAATQFRVAAMLREGLAKIGREPSAGTITISQEIRNAARTVISNVPSRHPKLAEALKRLDGQWPSGFVNGIPTREVSLQSLLARAHEVLSAMPRMREWILFQRALKNCDDLGLGPFIAQLGSTSATLARAAFERRFYTLWANAAIQKSGELAAFTSTRHHDLIKRFRLLDETLRRLAVGRIQVTASETARRIQSAQDSVGTASEVGILRYELQKKRRIKPLRKLFAEIPRVLQALKPCMLMSPISVSTYLKPGTINFDLVVFDEASQLPTPEAVPSILRATRGRRWRLSPATANDVL